MKKTVIFAICLGLVLSLLGCGSSEKAPTAEPTPTPSGQMQKNPVVSHAAAFLEEKDLSYAKALDMLDAYEGTEDIRPIVDGIGAAMSRGEFWLYEGITIAFDAQPEEDGSYTVSTNGEGGVITPVGENYTFTIAYEEDGQKRVFSGEVREDAFTASLHVPMKDGGELTLMEAAYQKTDGIWRAQFWSTVDEGITYDLVRYYFTDGSFQMGSWQDAARPQTLSQVEDADFFSGAVTKLFYDGSTINLTNDGKDYEL